VLCLIAFLIGYFEDSINISIGKRAEVQEPVPSTIVTNVTTNLPNNIVTNVITNAAPVKPNPNPVKPKPTPVKTQPLTPRTLTLEEKQVVGTYERKMGIVTLRKVFLDNGVFESYMNGKKQEEKLKWSIEDGEIHVNRFGHMVVWGINTDKSISHIGEIEYGKRTNTTKIQQQQTWKKINQPEPTRTITLEEKDIVGTYEYETDTHTIKLVLLENGVRELYLNGRKESETKWSIANGELHIKLGSGLISIMRINPDKSITAIANFLDGKRADFPKEEQNTWKKIK